MSKELSRAEIRRVFRRNRGTAADLARELDVSATTVHMWLMGRITSERIASAAEERARLLMDEEVTCPT